jgi:hypothetical protein
MGKPDPRGIFFDSKYFGEPVFNYVLWLDVMGTANQMLRSLPISANFIFKLHCAVLEAHEEIGGPRGVSLYPVMDGVYITSERRGDLQRIINQSLVRCATTFLNEPKPFHQFIVRGAVAFGPVYHGYDLDERTAFVLKENPLIRDSVLLGLPLAQAYQAEREAPPFGIAAHSSARAFAPEGDEPFRFIWLDWFRWSEPRVEPTRLRKCLSDYYDWQKAHHNMTGYDPERIKHHSELAEEYFTAST